MLLYIYIYPVKPISWSCSVVVVVGLWYMCKDGKIVAMSDKKHIAHRHLHGFHIFIYGLDLAKLAVK